MARTKKDTTTTTKDSAKAASTTKSTTKSAPKKNSNFEKWWETEGMTIVARGMDFRGIIHRALEAAGNGQSYASFLEAFNSAGLSVHDIKKAAELAFSL